MEGYSKAEVTAFVVVVGMAVLVLALDLLYWRAG